MAERPARAGAGRWQRAEGEARALVLAVGAGLVATLAGGLLMSGLAVRLTERLGSIEAPAPAFVAGWALHRVWLWLVLPWTGWVAGRWTRVPAWRFAWTAALAGEAFSTALVAVGQGWDSVAPDWLDAAARALSFLPGVWLTGRAAAQGQAARAGAEIAAQALVQQNAREYEAFRRQGEAGLRPPPGASPPA
jgi:hypothetical protein